MTKKTTLLVIDDEIHIRRLIARMLSSRGFSVFSAGSGTEAFKLMEQDDLCPDIITCDVSMPDMNGFEILDKIKQIPRLASIPVIMLTAMGQVGEAHRAKEMGASDYITKPFSANILFDVLRQHVSISE